MIDRYPRCWNCGNVLAHLLTRPYRVRCSRCKAQTVACSDRGTTLVAEVAANVADLALDSDPLRCASVIVTTA